MLTAVNIACEKQILSAIVMQASPDIVIDSQDCSGYDSLLPSLPKRCKASMVYNGSTQPESGVIFILMKLSFIDAAFCFISTSLWTCINARLMWHLVKKAINLVESNINWLLALADFSR